MSKILLGWRTAVACLQARKTIAPFVLHANAPCACSGMRNDDRIHRADTSMLELNVSKRACSYMWTQPDPAAALRAAAVL